MSSKDNSSSGQTQIPLSQVFKNSTQPSGASNATGSAPDTTARLPSNVPLFDVQLSSLTSAPKLKQSTTDAYQEWKQELKQWALAVGVWDMITTDAQQNAQEAVDFLSPHGFTSAQIEQKYRALHKRVWGALAGCIHGAMGNSLPNSIEAEQKRAGTKAFLEYNANYLWTKIQGTFEKKAGSASISLLEEFISLVFDVKQENPLQYRQRFESIVHRWNSIEGDEIKDGERISEQLKLAFLIRSLPRSHDTTIQAVFSANPRPTIDHVFQALTRQYDAGALGAHSGSTSSSANVLSMTSRTEDDSDRVSPRTASPRNRPAARRGNQNRSKDKRADKDHKRADKEDKALSRSPSPADRSSETQEIFLSLRNQPAEPASHEDYLDRLISRGGGAHPRFSCI
jgi:hypothetical protein